MQSHFTADSHNVTVLLPTPIPQSQKEAPAQSPAAWSTHSVGAPVIDTAGPTLDSEDTPSGSLRPSSAEDEDPPPTVRADLDSDSDSPLDNANFLSFEDWKKQNLAKAGQSTENVGNKRPGSEGHEVRRRPGNINNALDSLGEDSEIELDFGGFVTSSNGEDNSQSRGRGPKVAGGPSGGNGDENRGSTLQGAMPRSKDAGKTCKERFNYASFDCAATILKTNPQCKSSSSVLVENKDSYMLNECSADNKFLIVELCGDILIDTIVVANFEFFSSMFRTFRVSVSDRYPVKIDKWRDLGTFEARNTREVQAFLVENPLIWARYLRIEFLTHYSNEYYCPVSLLRVHGTTMMEEFRHQEEAARAEEEGYEDDVVEAGAEEDVMVPESTNTRDDAKLGQEFEANATISQEETVIDSSDARQKSSNESVTAQQDTEPEEDEEANDHMEVALLYEAEHSLLIPFNASNVVCYQIEREELQSTVESSESTHTSAPQAEEPPSKPMTESKSSVHQLSSVPASVSGVSPDAAGSIASTISASSSTPVTEPKNVLSTTNVSLPTRASNHTQQDQGKIPSSTTTPPHANPTTQENFFKSIHKRLQLLEVNSTLSLQYIEDQSRILRDAFTKVEKRQLAKTTSFLENLNTTVLSELRGFRQQYDQIWQSTVIELETQREQSHREVVAISARLSILADEVIFQKRMSIVQSVLILVCLGLVIFSRGAASSCLELPLVQNMVSKSQRTLRHSFESPSESPPSTRPTSSRREGNRFGFFSAHSRDQSEDSVHNGTRDLIIEYSPPTPTSDAGHSDASSAGRRSPSPTPSESPEKPVTTQAQFNNTTPPRSTGRLKRHSMSWPESDFVSSGLLRPDTLPERSKEHTQLPRSSKEPF